MIVKERSSSRGTPDEAGAETIRAVFEGGEKLRALTERWEANTERNRSSPSFKDLASKLEKISDVLSKTPSGEKIKGCAAIYEHLRGLDITSGATLGDLEQIFLAGYYLGLASDEYYPSFND